jgi:methyl-accepting chemotaxis protein
MDNATQQNAALVEEAAAAAQSMQEQAANLAQAVSVFKLDRLQETPRLAAKAAPARIAASAGAQSRRLAPATRGGDDWEQF